MFCWRCWLGDRMGIKTYTTNPEGKTRPNLEWRRKKPGLTKPKVLVAAEQQYSSVVWHCWLNNRKGIRPVKPVPFPEGSATCCFFLFFCVVCRAYLFLIVRCCSLCDRQVVIDVSSVQFSCLTLQVEKEIEGDAYTDSPGNGRYTGCGGFSKCGNFRGRKARDGQNATSCQISRRSVQPLLRYGHFSIF